MMSDLPTSAQRAILDRGYCILFLDNRRPVDVAHRTWAALIDRGWIAHERSNLDAKRPWEVYRRTPAGSAALQALKEIT